MPGNTHLRIGGQRRDSRLGFRRDVALAIQAMINIYAHDAVAIEHESDAGQVGLGRCPVTGHLEI